MKAMACCAIAVVFPASVASAQVPAGPEFRVNTYTTGPQAGIRLGATVNGDFIVVWHTVDDGMSFGVSAQRYDASGAPRGGEFRVNTYTTGEQSFPAVAVGSRGDFVVVWAGEPDGSARGIQARRYDASGRSIGAEFQVNTYTTGEQVGPSVRRGARGQFVVGWTDTALDGSDSGIAARLFDASWTPVGAGFLVNSYTIGQQVLGDVDIAADGSFVAVYTDLNNGRDGSGFGVFGQRFDASGARLGGEFQVNSYTTGNQSGPSLSMFPSGGFVVSWTGVDGINSGIMARRFDESGNPAGNDFVVNTNTVGWQRQTGAEGITHDARGNFVITWASADGAFDGVFAQRFNEVGARRGGEFRVNAYTTFNQMEPSVASDAVGNFVVTWSSRDDSASYGVFAQRFGGLTPAGLAVDNFGNRVLDPGETVEVRPSWRNFNGAAQTFGGALSGFTGPAGAAYTITDAVADYGTVADGTSAMCANCYALSVSNPPVRPAAHWDASVVESIVPDTHGQQKQWRLHVGGSFTDVPASSPFYRFIETLLHHNVTSGCTPGAYCPTTNTTRDQMAVFVLVAKEGTGYAPPACATPVFADVPASSPFCRWIEELARRGVVSGCGAGNYCPASAVTRDQMAIFVLRTLDPTLVPAACATPMYGDVPATSPFCRWVEELTRRNVVAGCGGGNYCPAANVTREQMGVFITATFGLTLYGP